MVCMAKYYTGSTWNLTDGYADSDSAWICIGTDGDILEPTATDASTLDFQSSKSGYLIAWQPFNGNNALYGRRYIYTFNASAGVNSVDMYQYGDGQLVWIRESNNYGLVEPSAYDYSDSTAVTATFTSALSDLVWCSHDLRHDNYKENEEPWTGFNYTSIGSNSKDRNDCYIVGSNGTWVSGDAGVNWTEATQSGLSNTSRIVPVLAEDSTVVTIDSNYVIKKSLDSGETFSTVSPGLSQQTLTFYGDLGITPTTDYKVFCYKRPSDVVWESIYGHLPGTIVDDYSTHYRLPYPSPLSGNTQVVTITTNQDYLHSGSFTVEEYVDLDMSSDPEDETDPVAWTYTAGASYQSGYVRLVPATKLQAGNMYTEYTLPSDFTITAGISVSGDGGTLGHVDIRFFQNSGSAVLSEDASGYVVSYRMNGYILIYFDETLLYTYEIPEYEEFEFGDDATMVFKVSYYSSTATLVINAGDSTVIYDDIARARQGEYLCVYGYAGDSIPGTATSWYLKSISMTQYYPTGATYEDLPDYTLDTEELFSANQLKDDWLYLYSSDSSILDRKRIIGNEAVNIGSDLTIYCEELNTTPTASHLAQIVRNRPEGPVYYTGLTHDYTLKHTVFHESDGTAFITSKERDVDYYADLSNFNELPDFINTTNNKKLNQLLFTELNRQRSANGVFYNDPMLVLPDELDSLAEQLGLSGVNSDVLDLQTLRRAVSLWYSQIDAYGGCLDGVYNLMDLILGDRNIDISIDNPTNDNIFGKILTISLSQWADYKWNYSASTNVVRYDSTEDKYYMSVAVASVPTDLKTLIHSYLVHFRGSIVDGPELITEHQYNPANSLVSVYVDNTNIDWDYSEGTSALGIYSHPKMRKLFAFIKLLKQLLPYWVEIRFN
jgi:hypothetical protein